MAAWLARVLIVAVIVGLGFYLPTLFFDDAYITFRYAANLAHGGGLTYNPPEHVLGVTTPLLALLLAAAARFGVDIETAAMVAGLVGHALLCLAVIEAVPLLLPGGIAPRASTRLLAAVACALHPHLAFTAMGGMETSLYCALIIATLVAAERGRGTLAGALLGVAMVTRPDAVLLALPALWLLRGGRRPRSEGAPKTAATWGRALLGTALVAAPWAAFATYYYGSPVPHSIAAKRLIHPATAEQVLGEFGRFLRDDYYLLAALPLALWALARGRRPLAGAMTSFALLYACAVIFGGVEPFAWYVNPLLPIVLTLGAVGLIDLASALRARGAWVPIAATVVVAALAIVDMRRQIPDLRESWDAWEGTYEIAARWIMTDSKPGDSVYVGETGVIGYLLPGRRIIDSSGINSPEVYGVRKDLPEQDPEWSRRIIKELKPDYISSSLEYIHIQTLAQEPWFVSEYEEVAAPLVRREGHVIYRRRRAA